jgi:hypothetical protein
MGGKTSSRALTRGRDLLGRQRADVIEIHSGTGTAPRLLLGAAVLAAGFALVHQWPEIQRYLKMRSM